jgi:glycosyltransferase involved in cell wall biosynthesis
MGSRLLDPSKLHEVPGVPTNGPRLRVLVVAEAANPQGTSVSLIGWQFAKALSEVADVLLVTEKRNIGAIKAVPVQGLAVTDINNRFGQGLAYWVTRLLNGNKSLGWTTYTALYALTYPLFERKVWGMFKDEIRRGQFDVVHRITPNSPVTTSFLAGRCREAGVPFIMGPINGGVPWPKEYPHLAKAERDWLAPLRKLARLNPGYWSTRRAASAILLGSRYAAQDLPACFHEKGMILSENAVDADAFTPEKRQEAKRPLRAVFVGRLVPLKGLDILIEAAAPLIEQGNLQLQIIGAGPEKERLVKLASTLSVHVDFPGWVSQADLPAYLAKAHLFTFPSLREFGGGVVIEAMAAGAVPIVVNYGGPPELVPPDGGIVIPMGPKKVVVSGMRNAIEQLCSSLPTLQAMSRVARQHVVANYTWKAKALQAVQLYNRVGCGAAARSASGAKQKEQGVEEPALQGCM